ncbi:MAG: nucleotidyltransferase family protein [Pseudomonadota bacterium]
MTSIAGLVLAAGFARRFGSDKRRAVLSNGLTLLGTSVATVHAGLPDTWLVLRPSDDAEALGLPASLIIVRSEAAEGGLGHSLASGMRAIARDSSADAVAIFLGDMPWITAATLDRLFAVAAPEHIVLPEHEGQPGHPVIIGRRFWPDLLLLTGDTGAKSVLQTHAEAVRRVRIDDPGVLQDVDTPAALRQ